MLVRTVTATGLAIHMMRCMSARWKTAVTSAVLTAFTEAQPATFSTTQAPIAAQWSVRRDEKNSAGPFRLLWCPPSRRTTMTCFGAEASQVHRYAAHPDHPNRDALVLTRPLPPIRLRPRRRWPRQRPAALPVADCVRHRP